MVHGESHPSSEGKRDQGDQEGFENRGQSEPVLKEIGFTAKELSVLRALVKGWWRTEKPEDEEMIDAILKKLSS
jgi:Domain of unknown function (DUF1744)